MTLTTKKSRPIQVNDKKYRYQVSSTKIDKDWNFSLNLTVQKADSNGCALKVEGLITRDIWLDFSDSYKWDKDTYPTILPRHIARLIKNAISQGWKPEKQGKAFVSNTTNILFFN